MRAHAIQEEAIVRDDHGAPGKAQDRLFERAERLGVEVVRGLVEKEQVAALGQLLGEVQAVALTTRERADLLLLA